MNNQKAHQLSLLTYLMIPLTEIFKKTRNPKVRNAIKYIMHYLKVIQEEIKNNRVNPSIAVELNNLFHICGVSKD